MQYSARQNSLLSKVESTSLQHVHRESLSQWTEELFYSEDGMSVDNHNSLEIDILYTKTCIVAVT